MADAPWATKEQARAHWPDAVNIADAVLDTLIDIATEQCEAYAPPLEYAYSMMVSAERPSYMLATVYQARELHSASVRGEQDVIGVGDYAIRARPMTAAVKQLLRPKRGFAGVG